MLLLAFVSVSYVLSVSPSGVRALTIGDVVGNSQQGFGVGAPVAQDPRSGGGGSILVSSAAGWCDQNGRLIVDNSVQVVAVEAGSLGMSYYGYQPISWTNSSGTFDLYRCVSAADAAASFPDPNIDSGGTKLSVASQLNAGAVTFAIVQSGFVVGVIVAGIAMFAVLGLNVLGSGENMFGTKAVGLLVLFGGLWAIVSSVGSFALVGGAVQGVVVSGIPVLGWIVYLFLTFAYMLGVYQLVGGGFP